LTYFYEIQEGSHATESDFEKYFLMAYLQHSKMADVQTSKVDEKDAPLNVVW
jgi:hypothetical protein